MQIATDGSLLVAENITITGAFHGANRDIPVRKGETIDHVVVSEQGKKYTPGRQHRARQHRHPRYLRSRPAAPTASASSGTFRPPARHARSRSAYRFRGLAVAYDDVVDVNMKVWGDQWPSRSATCERRRRSRTRSRWTTRYRVWGHPAWVKGAVARTPEAATLHAVDVPAHQFVEERVVFPRSLLTSTAGAKVKQGPGSPASSARRSPTRPSYVHDQAKLDDAKHHMARTLLLPAAARPRRLRPRS